MKILLCVTQENFDKSQASKHTSASEFPGPAADNDAIEEPKVLQPQKSLDELQSLKQLANNVSADIDVNSKDLTAVSNDGPATESTLERELREHYERQLEVLKEQLKFERLKFEKLENQLLMQQHPKHIQKSQSDTTTVCFVAPSASSPDYHGMFLDDRRPDAR